jgi:hypothetical protein
MPRPPGHAVVALAIAALSCAASPAHAQGKGDPAAIEQAKKHMKAGADLYNDPPVGHKCEEALGEFAKAYELSGSINALKGMAICSRELEHDADAIEQYTAYLAGKGSSLEAKEKALLEGDLNALKEAVATVKLSADMPGVRVTDVRTPAKGMPIHNGYKLLDAGEKGLGIHPGDHVFTASLDGFPDQVWKVEIGNGGSYSHTFTFKRPPEPVAMIRPVPTAVWVTTGLTGALTVTWGALAVRAKLKNDDYAKQNGHAPAGQLETMRSGVKTANLVADVFLGAAVAGLGTTLALYFTRPSKPAKAGSLTIAPSVGGAVIGGSF